MESSSSISSNLQADNVCILCSNRGINSCSSYFDDTVKCPFIESFSKQLSSVGDFCQLVVEHNETAVDSDDSLKDGFSDNDASSSGSDVQKIVNPVLGGLRRRGKNAIRFQHAKLSERLERLKQKRSESNVKHVVWKDCDSKTVNSLDNSKIVDEHPFQYREPKKSAKGVNDSSMATNLIENMQPVANCNPFLKYAQFDAQGTNLGKTLNVFVHLLADQLMTRCITVCVSNTARVLDLIGLVCFHYTDLEYTPQLKPDISYYNLYVSEDDGEPYLDLPPKETTEPVTKFHFPVMALVEESTSRLINKVVFVKTIFNDLYEISIDWPDETSLFVLRNMALEKYQSSASLDNSCSSPIVDLNYDLEKVNAPGIALNLEMPVSKAATDHFFLVRHNSARPNLPLPSLPFVLDDIPALKAPRMFSITWLKKSSKRIIVQFTLNENVVEIRPEINRNRPRRLFSIKQSGNQLINKANGMKRDANGSGGNVDDHFELNIENIEDIDVARTDSQSRLMLRFIYLTSASSSNFYQYEFEGDLDVIREIRSSLEIAKNRFKKPVVFSNSLSHDEASSGGRFASWRLAKNFLTGSRASGRRPKSTSLIERIRMLNLV